MTERQIPPSFLGQSISFFLPSCLGQSQHCCMNSRADWATLLPRGARPFLMLPLKALVRSDRLSKSTIQLRTFLSGSFPTSTMKASMVHWCGPLLSIILDKDGVTYAVVVPFAPIEAIKDDSRWCQRFEVNPKKVWGTCALYLWVASVEFVMILNLGSHSLLLSPLFPSQCYFTALISYWLSQEHNSLTVWSACQLIMSRARGG